MSNIGIGIAAKECLNYCPFSCSRNFGKFVVYYTSGGKGALNCGEVGSAEQPADYKEGFEQGDTILLAVDLDAGLISFGKNDVMFEAKEFNPYLFGGAGLHLGVWLDTVGDEVHLISEI